MTTTGELLKAVDELAGVELRTSIREYRKDFALGYLAAAYLQDASPKAIEATMADLAERSAS